MAHPGTSDNLRSARTDKGRTEPRSWDWRQVVAQYEQDFPTNFPLLGNTYAQRVEAVLIDASWSGHKILEALKDIAN